MRAAKLDIDAFTQSMRHTTASVDFFKPEIVLVLTALAVLLVGVLKVRRREARISAITFGGLAGAIILTLQLFGEPSRALFSGMIVIDDFANFFKLIFLVGTLVVVILTSLSKELRSYPLGEYYALLLSAVLGMFLMASSTDLLMFFVAVELVSIPSYILVVYRKGTLSGSEAGLKYVIYGSVASGLMIYGLSFFYGLTGTTDLAALRALQVTGATGAVLVVSSFLVLAGFAYKMASAPMHFWCPDVYEGAPTAITAWLSVTSKAAGFALFIRFLWALDVGSFTSRLGERILVDWPLVVAFISALTMTIGNLGALFQTNIKRMLAYSSIAHAGYLLMGVAALKFAPGAYDGFMSVAFYLVVYTFMNLGVFTVVILIRDAMGSESIEEYRGLGKRAPLLAIALSVFLVSLIGLPPTGGFVGKFQLFMVVIRKDMYWLAIVAALNTAVSVYYYWRIVKYMYLDSAPAGKDAPVRSGALGASMVVAQAAVVVYLGILFSPLVEWIQGFRIH